MDSQRASRLAARKGSETAGSRAVETDETMATAMAARWGSQKAGTRAHLLVGETAAETAGSKAAIAVASRAELSVDESAGMKAARTVSLRAELSVDESAGMKAVPKASESVLLWGGSVAVELVALSVAPRVSLSVRLRVVLWADRSG